mgnify:CR=1 FL=1
MDWASIRVLSDNLGELLDQHKRGEHLEVRVGEEARLKEEWWVGIRGLSASLERELGVGTPDQAMGPSFTALLIARDPDNSNSYMRRVKDIGALARKLLADMDAVSEASPVAAARSGGEIVVLSECEVDGIWHGQLRIRLKERRDFFDAIEVSVDPAHCDRVRLNDPVQMVLRKPRQ